MAKSFISNPKNKPEVNHIDGDKQNNNIKNLEWVEKHENIQHAVVNSLKKSGSRHRSAKLTPRQVKEIKATYIKSSRNYNLRILANKYGVSCGTISNIVNCKTYKNQ